MKTNIFKTLLWIPLVICGLTLSACGGDDEEGGGGSTSQKHITDYLEFKNIRAHYVGKVVIVDFDIKNKTNRDYNDISVRVNRAICDNGDDITSYTYISAGEGKEYYLYYISNLTLAGGETRSLRIQLSGDELATIVAKMKINLVFGSNQMGLSYTQWPDEYNAVSFTTDVTDDRATRNTVWSNDDHIKYSQPTIEKDGNDMYLTFIMTNQTGVDFINSTLSITSINNGNGSTTNWAYIIIDGNSELYSARNFTLNNGKSKMIKLYVPDFFKTSASCVNATIQFTCDQYQCASNYFYIVSAEI